MIEGNLFFIVELVLSAFFDVGEEIVIMAEKSPNRLNLNNDLGN